MKKNPDISYLLIPNMDGITTAFPVSKHVLDTSSVSKPDAFSETVRRYIPTIARPATSIGVILCLWTMSIGGSYAGSSTAYFSDSESSKSNVFSAASLDFDLNPGEVTVPITPGTPTTLTLRYMPDTGFPVTYRITTELVGDPNTLCSRLHASGTTSPYLYSGALLSLVTAPETVGGYGYVDISLTDESDLIPGMQCTVDFVYRGWHTGMPENAGYTDRESDRFTFVYGADAVEAEAAPIAHSLTSTEEHAEPESDITVEPSENDPQDDTTEETSESQEADEETTDSIEESAPFPSLKDDPALAEPTETETQALADPESSIEPEPLPQEESVETE